MRPIVFQGSSWYSWWLQVLPLLRLQQETNLERLFRCKDLVKLSFIEGVENIVFMRSSLVFVRRCWDDPHDDAEVHNGALRRSLRGSVLALMTTIRGNLLASSLTAAR